MIRYDNYSNNNISSPASSTIPRSKPLLSFDQTKWFAKMIRAELVKCLNDIEHEEDEENEVPMIQDSLSCTVCCSKGRDESREHDEPASCQPQHEPTKQHPAHKHKHCPAYADCCCDFLPATEMTVEQLQRYVVKQMPYNIVRKVPIEDWNRIFGSISHHEATTGRLFNAESISRPGLADIALRQSTSYRNTATCNNEEARTSEENAASARPTRNTSVSFGFVMVRYYNRSIDFNPAVSKGPAIGLDWTYYNGGEIPVDVWEETSDSSEITTCSRKTGFVLSHEERIQLLLDLGYTQDEIADATKAIVKTRNERAFTAQNLHHIQGMEDAIETAARRVKQLLSFGKKRGLLR